MSSRSIVFALAFVIATFFLPATLRAQGVIVPIVCDIRPCRPIPRPIPRPLPNALPVKSIKLDTKINGQVATTHVEQVFRNDTPYTLEGTYFFPIPETASIVEFAIWENGKRLVGEVRTREEARRIYDEIVRRQRDPGLLEYAGKDLFQASIFPIPPNSDKKLELKYTEVLKATSGTVAYRYPLGTGRNVWARGTDLRPASGPGPKQEFGTVSGTIEITASEPLRNIYSPSHQIDVKRKNGSSANVTFETTNNDTDLQLYYGLSTSDIGLSLVTYREPGKDGYFLMMLSPKDSVTEKELVAKDIVFVLDTSGSMADEGKMDKARKALLFGIRTLRDSDRFNVISFAGEERLMESGLISANADGKKRGEEFVNKLQPTGGTNINDSLIAAMRQFDRSERPKMMVFMTDGLPTVGETNVERIIKNSRENSIEGLRLFTFGVGYDVNTRLLDKLAAENAGDADYVEPKEDLEIKVSNFFSKVSSPVLSNIELDWGSVQTDLVYPRKFSDIFRGSPVTLIGRYKNEADLQKTVVRMRGRAGREERTFEYKDLEFPLRNENDDFLPRLWATRRVGWLVEQIRTNGENKELRDEVVQLGTRYGIVTPYTSYLATDGSERSISNLPLLRRDSSAMRATISADAIAPSGAGAVTASKKAREQQRTFSVADEEAKEVLRQSNVLTVGSKTFYLENGVWVDSEYREAAKLPETRLVFGTDAYFDFALKEKAVSQYLAMGDQLILVWNGRVIRVTK